MERTFLEGIGQDRPGRVRLGLVRIGGEGTGWSRREMKWRAKECRGSECGGLARKVMPWNGRGRIGSRWIGLEWFSTSTERIARDD